EQMTFRRDQLAEALADLRGLDGVEEAVVLSTCNRTEIYAQTAPDAGRAITNWLTRERAPRDPDVAQRFYRLEDSEATRHLLRVACGLDSMVLGEPQILGQLKQAYQLALEADSVGPSLHRLFQHAFSVAKQVRTDTRIGASPVSVAFAAVRLARQIFADFQRHTALLVGAGETIELAARHLTENGIGRLIIANRSPDRAQALAAEFRGYGIALPRLPDHLGEADIVICSTASPDPVLKLDAVEKAFTVRKHRPMFVVDIAVPRDVEATVGDLEDVYLYTIDDLRGVIEEGLRSREAAAREADEIIEAQVAAFQDALRSLDAVPTIRDLRTRTDEMRKQTLERARQMLESGRPPEDALEYLANTLSNRLLHAPTARLRAAGREGAADVIEAARYLFSLDRGGD
ncbi:MAG: glutamyl-tRNA reductase, partial [Gammaproteobacteria bacterium]